MQKIIKYILQMLADREGLPNTKLHFGAVFSICMIVGLFVGVDSALYSTFAICTMGLLGLSCVDNLTSPKITVDKKETTNKESKTEIDVANIATEIKKIVKKD